MAAMIAMTVNSTRKTRQITEIMNHSGGKDKQGNVKLRVLWEAKQTSYSTLGSITVYDCRDITAQSWKIKCLLLLNSSKSLEACMAVVTSFLPCSGRTTHCFADSSLTGVAPAPCTLALTQYSLPHFREVKVSVTTSSMPPFRDTMTTGDCSGKRLKMRQMSLLSRVLCH